MARKKDKSLEIVFENAMRELRKFDKDNVAYKLAAICSYRDNDPKQVSEYFQISKRTLFGWIKSYREKGIDGLRNKKKGHNPAILKQEHKKVIEEWIVKSETPNGEPIHWTLQKLIQYIEKDLGLVIKKSALSLTLRSMQISIRRPRPSHIKANPEKQEEFKKKLS